MTLTISVLLSIVVFLLLVSKILPPTSSTIPLMAKYLLLTFVLNVITILVTVIIINVYFRGPTTHRMPPWVRTVFLQVSQFLTVSYAVVTVYSTLSTFHNVLIKYYWCVYVCVLCCNNCF